MGIKRFKPIRIFSINYGYGWWWGEYFYFIGKGSVAFGIVPMFYEMHNTTYKNGWKIEHGDVSSFSEKRQREALREKYPYED